MGTRSRRRRGPGLPDRDRGREKAAAGPPTVLVNGYSENWLRQGFPWVYENEVVEKRGRLVPGTVVTLRTRQGAVLGCGIWDQGRIAVRRFRRDDGPLDTAFFVQCLTAAQARRALPAETTAWRWIHAENDDLPGIRVDRLGDDILVVLDSASLEDVLPSLVDAIEQLAAPRSIWLAWRLQHDADGAPVRLPPRQLAGASLDDEEVAVLERGVKVAVRPWDGPDVGLYMDMRDVRAWLEPHWRGKRVLNLFAYTSMFSVCAAVHGATEVHSVDLSEAYLERARSNFLLNGLDPQAHVFEQADSFKALDSRRRKQQRFDIVVADPPAYSHGPGGTWSIQKDLARLVSSCLRVLEPGGWLVIASNLGTMSPKDFQHGVHKGATKAGRSVRILHEGSTPADFPSALDFPESRYLKCWVLVA